MKTGDSNGWKQRPACRDVEPELFFPIGTTDAEDAKAVCRTCPITRSCLEWALKVGEFGVWGGTTEEERRALTLGAAVEVA